MEEKERISLLQLTLVSFILENLCHLSLFLFIQLNTMLNNEIKLEKIDDITEEKTLISILKYM